MSKLYVVEGKWNSGKRWRFGKAFTSFQRAADYKKYAAFINKVKAEYRIVRYVPEKTA